VDCAMLYLFWIANYISIKKIEAMFDVPHASCNEILHFMEKRVCFVILTNDLSVNLFGKYI